MPVSSDHAALLGTLSPQSAAEKAVQSIGLGYDVCRDIRFSACKDRLLQLDHNHTRDLLFPAGVIVPDVPTSVKCHQGDRFRASSGLLSFQQMSEFFNEKLSLSGKIPSGLFNAMFDMRNSWKKDAASTKSLAFDGCFITLYNVELDTNNRTHLTLSQDVKRAVPTSWNPAALAEFIQKYGTHIVVGIKMGGMDVVHIKQLKTSDAGPNEMETLLQQLANERFSEDLNRSSNGKTVKISGKLQDDQYMPWEQHLALAASVRPNVTSHSNNEDIISISVRRGGIVGIGQHHNQWISTISESPNVISMSLVPITSLLPSDRGYGFLRHAVNLYITYKPPTEELHQFLQFQLPREWALGVGPRRRKGKSPALQFSFMGSTLYVNTAKVNSGRRPVTGIRLFLEGRKSDHLGIHLQHLANLPSIIQILDNHDLEYADDSLDKAYFEPVSSKMFSHVCTAPVECLDSHTGGYACIVTKAWFEVRLIKRKKVLFLRFEYSILSSSIIRRSEWSGTSSIVRKSGFFSTLLSTRLSKGLHQIETDPKPLKDDASNAVGYHGESNTDQPVPTKPPKMLRFVDTKEVVRGPEDMPGHWMVTGARLYVQDGKISIKVKHSLLDYPDMDN
ncbi:MACPF domain-containing protein NSL1-like isoform X1 [Arachis stenosperma]|uniref:MACPF domain-containing protein NSL1-like isoform X1 n=1 Tax=Arachis stenosperma TaxID=217475 RepID=UPI0025ABCE7A|nr:MACPF domain-containing protein NSL1-like isoform X1 [Arachis stenosperma]